MKKVFIFFAAVLLTATLWAQSPEKMSYQAVIRDASDNLVTSQSVGMQISILQGSTSGTAVYVETQIPTTNANGLVSIEIGAGTVVSGDFATIDWSNGSYFIKTETDPEGGTIYTITGTSQLLSVPYALHAKTSETVTGIISETDPVYTASQAANITATDIINLGNLSGTNTGDQDLSNYFADGGEAGDADRTIGNTDDYALGLKTNNTIRLHIANNGYIGVGTQNPSKILEISNSSGNGTQIDLIDLNNQNDGLGSGSKIRFRTSNNSNTLARLGVIDEYNFGGAIQFEVNQEGVASDITTEVMRINKYGRVGIGTITPSTLLDVNGVISATNGNSTNWNTAYGWGNHADAEYLNSGDVITYSIGDFAQGGIVFWVDETGQHGLACAIKDQDEGSGIQWYNGSSTITSAVGDGLYAGKMNTMLIIANQGATLTDYAAGVCVNYSFTQNSVTYGDWYLPSRYELNLMYTNKATIDSTATSNGGSSFAIAQYWSSTEYNITNALLQYFNIGSQVYGNKNFTYRVRAIRAF